MMTRARRAFPGRPDQVARARAFVRACCDPCPATDEAVLLTSELCTNAVLHSASGVSGGSFEVRVDRGPRSLRVEVRDEGPRRVEPDGFGELAGNGRGLVIVGALASRWGQACSRGTRLAYFELDWAQPASRPADRPPAALPVMRPGAADQRCRAPVYASALPGPRSPAASPLAQRWFVTLDGRRLRELRTGCGLSQENICHQAGISTATIRRLEAERWPRCRSRTAALLARTLGTDTASLLAASQAVASGQ